MPRWRRRRLARQRRTEEKARIGLNITTREEGSRKDLVDEVIAERTRANPRLPQGFMLGPPSRRFT